MSKHNMKLGLIAAFSIALAAASLALQAEDAAPAAEAAGDAPAAEVTAPAENETASETAAEPEAAAPKPATPRPAEIAVKAVSNPLLRVVNTGKRFVAVGARGHILISADGSDWKQVASPVDGLLTSVAFANAENGWAVGHDAAILNTKDGGETWTLQNFQPELNKPLFDVLFLDASKGYAVGAYGLFLGTVDGGKSWTQVPVNSVTENERHINAITRLGDGSLLVVGEAGLIGLSPDQGASWQKIASPYESSLFCTIPAGEKGALIGGLRGNSFFAKEVSTGTWTKLETKSDQSLFGMAALPGDRIAMVGLNSTLLIFDNKGGARQIPITDKSGNKQTDSLSWITAAKDGSVIVVGDAGVQRLDAGKQ